MGLLGKKTGGRKISELVCGAWDEQVKDYIRQRTSVSDINRELYRQACESTAKFILQDEHLYKAKQIQGRNALLSWVLVQQRADFGLALEFGVGMGDSLRIIAHERPVHGFDSFKGLPETWRSGYEQFAFADAAHYIPELSHMQNIELHIGWFAESLGEFIYGVEGDFGGDTAYEPQLDEKGIALLHIDSDLYESASTVLQTLYPWFRKNTYIVFDEYFNYPGWQRGEAKAWWELAREGHFSWRYVAYNSTGEQVVIRIDES